MSLSDLPGNIPDPSAMAASSGGSSTAALAEPERKVPHAGSPGWSLSTSASMPPSSGPSTSSLDSRPSARGPARKRSFRSSPAAVPRFHWWPIRCSAPSPTVRSPVRPACPVDPGGAILAAAALLAMSGATTVALMLLFWCLVQLGANAAYAAITAAVPDRVPVPQRATVGGLAAMGQTVGILLGAVFGAVVSGNYMVGYWLCAAALVLSVVPYLFHRNDPVLPRPHARRSS